MLNNYLLVYLCLNGVCNTDLWLVKKKSACLPSSLINFCKTLLLCLLVRNKWCKYIYTVYTSQICFYSISSSANEWSFLLFDYKKFRKWHEIMENYLKIIFIRKMCSILDYDYYNFYDQSIMIDLQTTV